MPTVWNLHGSVLEVKIDGRITVEAIEGFGAALQVALDRAEPFTVCFDRTSMTGPTKDGRAALEQWAAHYLPQLPGRCLGWADVFDPRRMASIERAAASAEPADELPAEPPYPQQTFGDLTAARAWLSARAGTCESPSV